MPDDLLHRTMWEVMIVNCLEKDRNIKTYVVGDCMNHLSITVYHRWTSTNQINRPYNAVKLTQTSQEQSENIFCVEHIPWSLARWSPAASDI